MYPPINKEQLPSAPPSYIESVNAQRYAADPQSMAPHLASQQPTQVIIVQAPGLPPLGPQSVEVTCPTCKAVVLTSVEEEASTSAYLCCMLMCVVGCMLCSCLPFCMDSFKNYKHTCPRCNSFIGTYQP
jgi:lipopolysaccharide-induced tumor necrosis factor-alpha factor